MKTGHVEKTNDRDFETELRRYRTMETAANKLQKEAKGYLDSLRAMTASQMRIAETIDAFYGDAGARDGELATIAAKRKALVPAAAHDREATTPA